jgi:hypothetical protein
MGASPALESRAGGAPMTVPKRQVAVASCVTAVQQTQQGEGADTTVTAEPGRVAGPGVIALGKAATGRTVWPDIASHPATILVRPEHPYFALPD